MGIISAFFKKIVVTEEKLEHNNINSNFSQLLDRNYSFKTNAKSIGNIEDLVDYILAKNKVSSPEEGVEDSKESQFFDNASSSKKSTVQPNVFVYSKNTLKKETHFDVRRFIYKKGLVERVWHRGRNEKTLGIVLSLPIRRVLSVLLSFLLVFVAIASASILSLPVGSDSDVLSVSLDPESIHDGDPLLVNVTVPTSYNIRFVKADFGGIESIALLLIDNSTDLHVWGGSWFVHGLVPGEHIMTITALDNINGSYVAGTRLTILPDEEPVGNESLPPSIDDTNMTQNDTIPPNLNDTNIPEAINQSEFGTAEKIIYQDIDQNSELIERRTLYSKTFQDIDGPYQKRIGVGPIHYPDENGNLDDINTNFVISDILGYDYEVTRGFYKTKLKAFLDSTDLVEYRFDDSFFRVEVQDLYWSGENGEKELISLPQHVGGIVHGNKITYSDAYDNGIDVEFIYHPQYFGKNLIIDSLPVQNPSNNYSYLQFNFKMILSDDLEVFVDDQKLDENGIITQGKVEFRDKDTNKVLFFFNEPYSEDSQDNKNPISLSLKKIGSEIWISKMISKDWLEQAVYPIRADADTIYLEGDIYDMYDDDGSNVDGDTDVQIGRAGGSHWDGYWAFPISSDILNGTINSVTFTGYVSTNDINVNPVMYGLQQENCPPLEGAEDPSGYTRTTNSYTWAALQGGGTGSKRVIMLTTLLPIDLVLLLMIVALAIIKKFSFMIGAMAPTVTILI